MHTNNALYFDVPRPQRLSRLLIFVKWLLIFPHLFILYFYGIVASFVGFVAWWAILFTGRYPEGMWGLVYGYLRWNTRVGVYTYLLRDEYPPFGEEPYPMQMQLDRPERQSRLLLFVRIITIIPLALWLGIVGIFASVLLFVAWWAILFTGNIPTGIFEFLVKFYRYSLRVNVYAMNLTDAWPGFSLD